MKILFIFSIDGALSIEKPLGSPLYIQFGISYLSSLLKQHNHDTKLLILSRIFGNRNHDIIRKKIEIFKPDIIGFYSIATQYKFISSISKFIKLNYPEIFLIIGGPHATINPEEVAKDSFDAICIGEGEIPMLELANMLEKNEFPSNIKNLWIKKDGTIKKNQMAPFYEKIDLFPFPDRTIWDEYIDYVPNFLGNNISILIGRGCPFDCPYCCNHVLRKITDGNYVRYRSPRNIIEEIKLMHENYPLENNIFLEIESFNINKEWAVEVCSEIEKYNKSLDTPLSFGLNIRIIPNVDFETLFEACRKANISHFNIGLESGSERVRKDILKRNYSNDDVIKTTDLSKKYGLSYKFQVMIGTPGETIEDFRETVKICKICQPKEVLLYIFHPYPGTDLYEVCKKMNLFQDQIDIKLERKQAIFNLPGFSRKQIQRSYIWFDYYVYKSDKPKVMLILKGIIKLLKSNYFIDLILTKFFHSHYKKLYKFFYKP